MNTRKPSSLPTWPVGWSVRHVVETGSTNDDLFTAARAGAPDRSVIVADFQTAGKGRIDRRWEATRGTNLLVSLLFRAEPRATKLVALACRAACTTLASVEPALKWPNDLII